ncbi:L10-interacting MYB domain-containing protein isoform X1 [Vigna radiata var. radiata]|uniref:L10-interacting MYB domain-containing protein isoform X1 n=1 Tax=Vigna radiata var. radiata TaxID=3916 RepID=A0A1S3VN78_VIGRR|nr:L10-interacting MYB domain-containing protein isoform X1 [Vigna radiata var. radiata]XP_022643273.1 L10-interacting MYB domain-containing protein isoform X1 [Vigna radiata var. radiata]
MAGQFTRSRRLETQQQEQSRARWTTSLTKILATLMVDQVHKGNKHNNLFNKKAWKYICDEFYSKTGLKWDKEQLKNRYSVLRRQYSIVKSILDQSDFSWDESTGSITANDEIWAEYIKRFQKHPDAEIVKTGGCPIFKELCTIFSEPATNGKHEYVAASEGEHTSVTPCLEPLNTHHEESSSESQDEEDANDPQTVQPTTPTGISKRKRGRKGIDEAIADAIFEMASASKMRAAAIEQQIARFSMADCIRDLDLMQGVDQHLYFAAVDLFNKPNAREIFLSLKKDKRLTWLRGKCSIASNLSCAE